MTITVDGLLDAMAAQLATVEGIKTSDRFKGEIKIAEVKKRSFKAPAVYVAYGGAPTLQRNAAGQFVGDHLFAAFVVVTGSTKNPHQAVIDLAWDIADAIEHQSWGFDQASECAPGYIQGVDNLYSSQGEDDNIALYVVRFSHRLAIGRDRVAQDLDATTPLLEDVDFMPGQEELTAEGHITGEGTLAELLSQEEQDNLQNEQAGDPPWPYHPDPKHVTTN